MRYYARITRLYLGAGGKKCVRYLTVPNPGLACVRRVLPLPPSPATGDRPCSHIGLIRIPTVHPLCTTAYGPRIISLKRRRTTGKPRVSVPLSWTHTRPIVRHGCSGPLGTRTTWPSAPRLRLPAFRTYRGSPLTAQRGLHAGQLGHYRPPRMSGFTGDRT